MNILICLPTLASGKGGSEKVAVELGLAMRARGHAVSWAYKVANAQSGLRPMYAVPPDARLYPYDDTLNGMLNFRDRIKALAPDIILGFYATWQVFELYDLFHDLSIPLCLQECSNPERVMTVNWTKASNASLMRSELLRFASGIRVTREEYKASFPADILPGVEAFPNAFSRSREISFDPSRKMILHVGAAKANKNGMAMLDAFSLLIPHFPDWKLVLCTTTTPRMRPEYEEIKRRIKTDFPSGSIILHENMEDMEHLYSQASIHCITSLSEGLPNCVCESMCHGIPSVGFANSIGTSLLISHEHNGLLAADGPHAMAASLRTLMMDNKLRERLGKNAWEDAAQFKPQKIYDAWEKFLLAAQKRGARLPHVFNTISQMATPWHDIAETTWRAYLEKKIGLLSGDIIFFGSGNLYVNFRHLFGRLNPVCIAVDGKPQHEELDGLPVIPLSEMDDRIKKLPIAIFSKDAKVIEHRLRTEYGAHGDIICVDRRALRNAFAPGVPHPLKRDEMESRTKLVARGSITYKTFEEPAPGKINRQTPACAFCGSTETSQWLVSDAIPWYGGDRFRLVRCQKCNLVFASPRPPESLLIEDICRQGEMFFQRKLARPNVQAIHDRMAKELLLLKPEATNVFDVAFGAGTLMRAFRKHGLQVYGNEINSHACRQMAAQGYEVINKPTREIDLENRFDIVTMLDYLEHTYTPFDDLLKAHSMLRDNGILYIKTLYLGCPSHLIKGEAWQLFGMGHFYYYLPETLIGMIETAGFNIVSMHKAALIHIVATKK